MWTVLLVPAQGAVAMLIFVVLLPWSFPLPCPAGICGWVCTSYLLSPSAPGFLGWVGAGQRLHLEF